MLKNILDPNWWAEKIGNKTGAYERHITVNLQNGQGHSLVGSGGHGKLVVD